MCDIDWNVIAAIASAIAAVAAAVAAFRVPISAERLAFSLQTAAAARERKLDLLRRVAGYRSQPPTSEWTSALNEIAVTFNDEPEVMSALLAFEAGIQSRGGHSNDDLLALITAMIGSLGLNTENFDREFFLRPFKPS